MVHIAFLSHLGRQMYSAVCSAVQCHTREYDAAFHLSAFVPHITTEQNRTQHHPAIMLQCSSVLYSEGLAPKNPMLPSGGTLDNVTKTIGRLLDGYDIRLRPNFGGELRQFYCDSIA